MKKKKYIILIVLVVIIAIAIYLFLTFSSIYSVQAVAVEAGSPSDMIPATERLDFGDISQGEQVKKTVVLENTGDKDHSIKIWMIGSIGQMIDVKPGESFELKAGTSQDVNFIFNMPDSAPEEKKYTGRIIILKFPW
ncbi:hypothetical protein ACFLXY_01125 [Chloroflexota bacterium]